MPRYWTRACCCFALLFLTTQAGPARAVDPHETLLPADTKGFVSITNLEQLSEHWDQTQLGQLAKDPVMQPFADDLRRQLTEGLLDVRRRLGISLDDLDGVPGGETSAALIQIADYESAVVLLIDVTGHHQEAQALLQKVSQNMAEAGAKRTRSEVSGAAALLFDLPKTADKPAQQTIYVFQDDLLAAADNLDVMKWVLGRVAGSGEKTLADLPAFQYTMARCQKDAGEHTPQIRWFLEPFGYSKATRRPAEGDGPRPTTTVEQLERAGFDAIQGLGGFIDPAVDGYELLHRTAIYAPKPHEKSMKMLRLPNAGHRQPPDWIPRDIATYTVIHCDLLGAFDNVGPLFDQVAGEGEEGIWIEALDSLKTDPDGPQIDLREEMFKFLDTEVIVITDYKLPITTTSERLLYAVAVKDAEAMKKALVKTQSVNEEVRRREFAGHVIWETIPPEKAGVKKVELPAPPLGLDEEEIEDMGEPLLPNMALCVAHGYFLIASHYDFLIRVLEPIDERERFSRSIDYRIVDARLLQIAPEANCVWSFSRTDEEYRPTYELIRQGKMPQSEAVLGRLLNNLLAPDAGAGRRQQIDGSKAPDFEFVRRYLGPAGTYATSEEDGWFFKGFWLRK